MLETDIDAVSAMKMQFNQAWKEQERRARGPVQGSVLAHEAEESDFTRPPSPPLEDTWLEKKIGAVKKELKPIGDIPGVRPVVEFTRDVQQSVSMYNW